MKEILSSACPSVSKTGITRAPIGLARMLARMLAPYDVTVLELKSILEQHRKGVSFKYPTTQRSLDARLAHDTIVASKARLGGGVDVLHLAGKYYLRFRGDMPDTIMAALPDLRLNEFIEASGLPDGAAILMSAASQTRSRERLIKLNWPLADC